jgi:molybdenum cofactor cytidylyltransferase
MGAPKMLLKWGQETILGHVISIFAKAGLEDILVITGAGRAKIERLVAETAAAFPVRHVFNPVYATGNMLSSIQTGLRDLARKGTKAAMIGLGDQPQVEDGTVRAILNSFKSTKHPLIVPTHDGRRGHPWLVGRQFWDEILGMGSPQTPRDFLNRHSGKIHYVEAGSPSIFADLDTPEDYSRVRPD